MVEGARLESVYMGNCIKSSNLLLSAKVKVIVNGRKNFYVYVLQTLKGFSFCTRQCKGLDSRLDRHQGKRLKN